MHKALTITISKYYIPVFVQYCTKTYCESVNSTVYVRMCVYSISGYGQHKDAPWCCLLQYSVCTCVSVLASLK